MDGCEWFTITRASVDASGEETRVVFGVVRPPDGALTSGAEIPAELVSFEVDKESECNGVYSGAGPSLLVEAVFA